MRFSTFVSAIALATAPSAAQTNSPPPGGSGGSSGVSSVSTACPAAGPYTNGVTLAGAITENAQTGTSYTIQASDCGKLLTFNNASAVAITLPQAGTTGFLAGFYLAGVQNLGTGTVAITPSTSTVNGAATLTLTQGQSASIVSDGTNYEAQLGAGGTGNVSGPASSTSGDLATYNGATGKTIQDSGTAASSVVAGPASATSGDLATYNGTTGKIIQDSGVTPAAGALTPLATAPGSSGAYTKQNGAITSGDCLQWSASGVQDTGSACGSGSGGGANPGIAGAQAYSGLYFPLDPIGTQIGAGGTSAGSAYTYCSPFVAPLTFTVNTLYGVLQTVGSGTAHAAIYQDAITHPLASCPLPRGGMSESMERWTAVICSS